MQLTKAAIRRLEKRVNQNLQIYRESLDKEESFEALGVINGIFFTLNQTTYRTRLISNERIEIFDTAAEKKESDRPKNVLSVAALIVAPIAVIVCVTAMVIALVV